MTSVVLDASALIAFLRSEPGADTVRKHLSGALISAVNYSEVLKKTTEIGGDAKVVHAHVTSLPLRIVPFDSEDAAVTASLYPQAKPHGLSMADRCCLALGVRSRANVLTTDADMAEVELPVKVLLIRGTH